MDKIYIQIPSYRDTELKNTIESMFDSAYNSDKFRVVIALQFSNEDNTLKELSGIKNLEIIPIPHEKSEGCNWARQLLQKRWRGERFTLLLDSHHRFAPNWDKHLIDMYMGISAKGINKPLITAYLPPYDPENDPDNRMQYPLKIYPKKWNNGILTQLVGLPLPCWTWLSAPIPAWFLSLHFLFGDGRLNHDLEIDPTIYFDGDEVLLSLRAYTNGYDTFHPHLILGWHLYNRQSRVTHWEDHSNWPQLQRRSEDKITSILKGNIHGKYGVGLDRSIKDYEQFIGNRLIFEG